MTFIFGMSSCDNYLDINTDPDNPNSEAATVDLRLPWIQNYYAYAWGTAGMRANTVLGLLTQVYSSTAANSFLAAWNPLQSSSTTIYQNWYVGAGVNIEPMIRKGLENEEYHYVGAGYCIKAMGFMMMQDLHGELPIEEAFIMKTDPKYDDGKKMYELCVGYLDEAIKNFNKAQPGGTHDLKEGDLWNSGNVDKWIKLCYGLKARYMLRISKKAEFDPAGILDALTKAPQSNADNTIMKHYNVSGDQTNITVADPYQTNVLWNTIGYGAGQRLTRYYHDLLTKDISGTPYTVKDPRLTKLAPAMMVNIKLDADGNMVSYDWYRDIGVDMLNSDKRKNSGPFAATYAIESEVGGVKVPYVDLTYKITDAGERATFVANMSAIHTVTVYGEEVTVRYQRGAAYCSTTNYRLAEDTIFVNMRSNSLSTSGRSAVDMNYYPSAGYPFVAGTGTFYARPNSDTDILTYHEMCFIKAEVYMRMGQTGPAFTAYQDGIKAHFDRMQAKLSLWRDAGSTNEDEWPMKEDDINAFLASPGICQSAGALTMAEIMRQKMIAMGFDMENWNDIRRFNYSAGNIGSFGVVYPGYDRPREFSATSKIPGSSATDPTYWFRRFQQSSHESNYNSKQLGASNKKAMANDIWSLPVWWDCATDDEYYGYIR
jgi:hypothetical protein